MQAVVYLDTQDYIAIFNEKQPGPHAEVFRELLELRDEGKAVFGYSFATIVEFITRPAPLFREERGRRGALIKELCQGNAFPPIWDIKNGAKFPNDGQWMLPAGQKAVNAKKFRAQARQIFRKQAMDLSGANRESRRKLAAQRMESLLARPGMKFGNKREHYPGLPVSKEVLEGNLLHRFLSGDCSDEEFESAMTRWLVDPEEYSRIVYDYADNPNAMEKFFGKTVAKFEEDVRGMEKLLFDIKAVNEQRLELRKTLRDAGVEKKAAEAATKKVKVPDVDNDALRKKLEKSLGEGNCEHILHYLQSFLSGRHSFKPSDMFDLFQFSYAYECDLFRCDKAMGNLYSNFDSFGGKLVTRFRDLPDRIRGLTS